MDLLDLLKKVHEKQEALDKPFPDSNFLGDIYEAIHDMILDSYGIPEDETLLYKYGTKEYENAFCRDGCSNGLYNFAEGVISKEKAIEELERIQKRFAGKKK